MAAVLADGETILENAAKEPEVVFLADILNLAGAKISGQGTDIIIIQGATSLDPIECTIFPDRIETGTFMIAAAITPIQIVLFRGTFSPNQIQAVIVDTAANEEKPIAAPTRPSPKEPIRRAPKPSISKTD